jgi:hypothetical protein
LKLKGIEMPSKLGPYNSDDKGPRRSHEIDNSGNPRPGSPKQLDRDTIYNNGDGGGSGKLPKNANR